MSRLVIYPDHNAQHIVADHTEPTAIAEALAEVGVRFERWQTLHVLAAAATPADILQVYAADVARLQREQGFATADVVSLRPDHPERLALRQKFLAEHCHSEDEVRFFVAGAGQFYLHLNAHVFSVRCTQGDLISVPANTRHWFDMGAEPCFTAIRLFTNPAGWVAQYTGDAIAKRFPEFEHYTLPRVEA